jgi:CHAD domain-containing protein
MTLDTEPAVQTFQSYGAQCIYDSLEKMLKLADAVRQGEDVEAVHDMRVASRRLRAAITLFGPAFASREFERFERDVKAVTRELGAARDLDVMIETLEKLENALLPAEQAGVDAFKEQKRREREALQPHVVQTLEKMEKRDLAAQFDRIVEAATSRAVDEEEGESHDNRPAKNHDEPDIDPLAPAIANAPHIVPHRVAELLSWEPHIDNPARVEELHNMRIAAKRLRYTLELFAPLYGSELKPAVAQVKKIQEQLGEIHDADVLVPALLNHLRRELAVEKGSPERGVYGADLAAAQGILTLCRARREVRDGAYNRFLRTWTGMRAAGFFDGLWIIVNDGKRRTALPPGNTGLPGGSANDAATNQRSGNGQAVEPAPEAADGKPGGESSPESVAGAGSGARRGRRPRVNSGNGPDSGASA